MKISELNTKVDIVSEVIQTGPVKILKPQYNIILSNIWAKKITLLGKESFSFNGEHSSVRVNFIIRARKGIVEQMYIKHEGIIYNIIGHEHLKNDEGFMLIATVRK